MSISYAARSLTAMGLAAALLPATALWISDGANAGTPSLFNALPGNWTGTGKVIKSDDTTENLRCKVKYSLTPSGSTVHQELLCAADSYRMNFVTDLINQDGKLAGTWKEIDRQAGGSVSGAIEGDVITTQIAGNGFRASVVITVKGATQTIALTSDTGNYAKAVTIALKAE